MLGGPNRGWTATISVPPDAAAAAALPILLVIEGVVFGLTTRMRIVKALEFAAEVEMLDALVVQHFRRAPGQRDLACRQHVGPLRDPQGHAGVLLDQEHTHAFVSVDGDN